MSERTYAVTVVEFDEQIGEERIIGQSVFEDRETALNAVDILFRFWSFEEDGKRVEVTEA